MALCAPTSGPLLVLILIPCCLVDVAQAYRVTSPSTTLNQSLLFPDAGNMKKDVVILGSLIPIHNYSSTSWTPTCGPLQDEDGILPLEALLFTIKQINNDGDLLPGIQLGLLALDSCNSPEVALQQSLRFMKGFLASQSLHHDTDFKCEGGTSLVYEKGKYDKVAGIIGGQRSSVSVQMANVFRLFKIPQISYRSTSSFLSDRDRYPYFLRTIPADDNQAKVILKVLKHLKASYVSLVYSNNEYGIGGYQELLKKAPKNTSRNPSVCFASPHISLRDDDPPERYRQAVNSLMSQDKSNVVVLFADASTAINLMRAMKSVARSNPENYRRLLWVGSDAWTSQTTSLHEFSDIIEEAIGIQPLAISLPGFQRYFSNLTPDSNKENPWFNEFWEHHFHCSLNDDKDCAKNSLKGDKTYANAKWLHLVRDVVYAFAHALHSMWESRCKGKPGFCEEMAHGDGHIHGDDLFSALKNVSFQDVANQPFQFQLTGDGTARYTIFVYRSSHLKRSPWFPIANFTYHFSEPEMNFLAANDSFPFAPTSMCGQPCLPGEERIIDKKDTCCWSCRECGSNQFLNTTSSNCQKCDECERTNVEEGRCVRKDVKYFDFRNQWSITSMTFASLGIFSTIFVGIIFWVHFDTPVIKAASRELSYTLLGGILLSFCLTFALLMPPSAMWCGLTRFFLGFSYTICYAAVLTKTNRIHRVFNINPAKPQKAKYTSSISQMVIVLLLVCVEVIIVVSWLVYYQPDVKEICKDEIDHNFLICKGLDDFSYIVGFLYPLFLVCLCTIYAIKTRKCPSGFNEARYIAFSNYTTCILWLIFIPLYLTTPAQDGVRVVSLSMSLSLSAFVQLGCLFIPKVHIVLFKPEKNTRDSIMSQPKGSSIGNPNTFMQHPHSTPANIHIINGSHSVNPTGNPAPCNSLPPNTYLNSSFQKTSGEPKGKNNPIYLAVPSPDYMQNK